MPPRNTPGGPPPLQPPRPGRRAAAPPGGPQGQGRRRCPRFVKSPDNWWLLLLLASAALYAQLLDAALAPKALEAGVTGDAKFYRDVVARHARVLVDGLARCRRRSGARTAPRTTCSSPGVGAAWRRGGTRPCVGASVFLDATGPLACVAAAGPTRSCSVATRT